MSTYDYDELEKELKKSIDKLQGISFLDRFKRKTNKVALGSLEDELKKKNRKLNKEFGIAEEPETSEFEELQKEQKSIEDILTDLNKPISLEFGDCRFSITDYINVAKYKILTNK